MKLKRLISFVFAIVLIATFTGCNFPFGNNGGNKTMIIKSAGDVSTIQAGQDLQFDVYYQDQKLSGAVFVVSGAASIDNSSGLLTCHNDAEVGSKITVAAVLSGYTCEDFELTVEQGDIVEVDPAQIQIVSPAANSLGIGTHSILANILPVEANQSVVFELTGTKPNGVSLLGNVVTITTDAQNGASFTVKAQAAAKSTITTSKSYTVSNPPSTPDPTSISITAPSKATLSVGTHSLTASVLPQAASQAVSYALTAATTGVSILGSTITITDKAEDSASFTVKATSVVKTSITNTKTYVVDNPPKAAWNVEPSVKRVFFDDFANGIESSKWQSTNDKWGNNNGVNSVNVSYTKNTAIASAFGAQSGGVAILQSNGDFMSVANRKRQGASLVTKEAFGPGKYEVRMKVLPRLGQCTALWTYWRGDAGANIPYENYESLRYSEIDIELPLWADYRNISGVSYQYYSDSWDWATQVNNRRDVVNVEDKSIPALNDGKWHTFAFDWRTNVATGDRAVIWYVDGVEFGRRSNWVPEYTATYWIGNWFPDDVSWIGDPLFENAYMYIDWVKITEYNDPVKAGASGANNQGTPVDIGSAAIPVNNYIANSSFSQPLSIKSFKNADISSWTQASGTIARITSPSNALSMSASSKATQTIGGQYEGYTYRLDVDAQVDSGSGKCKVYVEYLSGNAAQQNPTLTLRGTSSELEFSLGARTAQTLTFTVNGGAQVNHIRVVIQTEAGTTAKVYEVKMVLV